MISENLKRIIDARNLDAEAVAVICGVSYYAVQSWLSGTRTPSAASLRTLSVHLGVSVDELLAA